ncbi:MAG: TetR/AcrR family transcriptional regulator [Pseudomonadota bacterium]
MTQSVQPALPANVNRGGVNQGGANQSGGDRVGVDRGKEAVKSALIAAACELLADVGPKNMSVRNVAQKAGVNHGQVHHYFGGKQGLVEEAMQQLSEQHFRNARARSAGATLPEPLTLGEDDQYSRAMVRLILDGDLETALREISQGVSIPHEAVKAIVSRFDGQVPIEVQAVMAVNIATELGWAALEPYIFEMVEVEDADQEEVRAHAKVISRRHLNEILENSTPHSS